MCQCSTCFTFSHSILVVQWVGCLTRVEEVRTQVERESVCVWNLYWTPMWFSWTTWIHIDHYYTAKYTKVFESGPSTMTELKTHLSLQEGARLRFCRPCLLPFAIKDTVGRKLDRPENAGVLCKVTHAEWAALIVPVPKKDGTIRICGDYKVTINSALNIEQYPLTKPADLMASLTSGRTFSKLDITSAYQQMGLDEQSMKLVTINTHRGLYEYTHLPFGVASAPAVFQQAMDTILQGIPMVICYFRWHTRHWQNQSRAPSAPGGGS